MPLGKFIPFLATMSLLAVLAADHGLRADETSQADEQVLQDAGIGTEGASLLTYFRNRTLSEDDLRRLERQVRQLGDLAFRTREHASRELVLAGSPALAFLKPALADEDLEIARRAERCIAQINSGPGPALAIAAVRTLIRRQPADAVEVLLGYLPFAEEVLVEEEILNALVQLGSPQGKAKAALLTALREVQVNRRAAAAYVLGRLNEAEVQAAVQRLLVDAEVKVRLRAAQGLIAGKDKLAVPVLVALLEEAPADLCWHAEDLLQQLAGAQAPAVSLGDGSASARQLCRSAWENWWREQGPTVDLSRLEQGTPYLGLTVVAQMDLGKVWECGRDGRPRWTIDKLEGPLDAQVLPGGRVLIAEHHGRRVTERDLQGKIHWEQRLNNSPVTCQRLPNGNTFIATYGSLLEVTREGRQLYSFDANKLVPLGQSFPIYGAQKLRNGRIVCISLQGKVVELDALTGKLLKAQQATQGECYSVEGVPGGGWLVTNFREGKVLELDAQGQTVWHCAVPGVYHASRLSNGHTLVSNRASRRVAEIDRAGKTVWQQPLTSGNVWRTHGR